MKRGLIDAVQREQSLINQGVTLDKEQFTPLTWKSKDSIKAFDECIATTR